MEHSGHSRPLSPASTSILLVGATGGTGYALAQELLSQPGINLFVLVRQESLSKDRVKHLAGCGARVLIGDITDSHELLVRYLSDIDILLSAVSRSATLKQRGLVLAAKEANVSRFIPCAFMTCAPPGGLMHLRDEKEQIYQLAREVSLPYTIIDVGFWYQACLPKLPSGRVDYAILVPDSTTIYGLGNSKDAMIDLPDIARYTARIIQDDRTVNEKVFCYGDVLCQNQVFHLIEELSRETVDRVYFDAENLERELHKTKQSLLQDPSSSDSLFHLTLLQYAWSRFIREDNNPRNAKLLGYLDASELYPDFRPRPYVDFLKDLLAGRITNPYGD